MVVIDSVPELTVVAVPAVAPPPDVPPEPAVPQV
jgi:hypothetical protein